MHIPGSQHVDLLQELSDPDFPVPLMLPPAEQFGRVLGGLGVDERTRVVLYDGQASMWAARVWWMLRAYGFDTAAVLDGGLQTWLMQQRRTASGLEASPAPALLTPRPRPGIFVDKSRVRSWLSDPEVSLVDALQPESYLGQRQDYGRPGHLLGARNIPFSSVIDPQTQQYLPMDELRWVLAPALEGQPGRAVTYCGGAIPASSVAFALSLIGVENVSIYDGSLLEWAADPQLPLETSTSAATQEPIRRRR